MEPLSDTAHKTVVVTGWNGLPFTALVLSETDETVTVKPYLLDHGYDHDQTETFPKSRIDRTRIYGFSE